jgi:TetR/AcrR family transcriptional regulator, regulator of cefoperazone and chloramphenicol sensitivity
MIGNKMNQIKKNSTEEKIIIATITCIEKNGIHSITIRDIAKEAGVNIASINYYFRSKENLLEETLKFSLLQSFEENIEEIAEANKEPYSEFRALINDLVDGSIKWPNMVKAHLYNAFTKNDYNGLFFKWADDYLNRLMNKAESFIPEERKKYIKLSLVQMVSAVLFKSIFPDLFKEFLAMDLSDNEQQTQYIDCMLSNFFKMP